MSSPVQRMRAILDAGRWPSGLDLTPLEREILEANIVRASLKVTTCRLCGRRILYRSSRSAWIHSSKHAGHAPLP